MPDVSINEVLESVKTLRQELEKKTPDFEKIDRIEKVLEASDNASQKLLAQVKAGEQRELELKERLDGLEISIARGSNASQKNFKDSVEYKAMHHFVKTGTLADAEQKAVMRTDSDAAGGYLAPVEMDNAIIKSITEISNIRQIARVRTISAKSMEMPVRTGIPAAAYEGQTESGNESNSTYGNETVTAFRQTFTVPITMDMLMDAAFNMESEIMTDGAEAFAKGEGAGFVNGTGQKQPRGFLQDARVTGLVSTISASVNADDVILISGQLKTGYSPVYVFNRRTLAKLRTLKATDGNYLWQPGLNGVVANTINGYPYIIADDMPDLAANSKSVAFGDFMRGYTIVDRTGLSVVRDEYTRKKLAIVEFTLNRWNTGQVVLPEAIKIITSAP